MDMLLRSVTMTELAGLFRKHAECTPSPYLRDPKAIARAKRLAKKNGIWDDLSNNLDPTRDIPVIKRSDYRNYRRVGDRTVPQSKSGYRRRELGRAAMALWLGHPKADVDYLQDILWAYCDQWTWVMAAHEGRAIDLGSAGLAANLAEILFAVGDQLEDEVKDRVSREIERKIFEPFWNYKHLDSWKTVRMNWNHVCNGQIIRTALFQIHDPTVLAHMTHAAIQNLTYAIDGFTDDGGCEEGPGYWGYGFGHYLYVAYDLFVKTNGDLNLMEDKSGKIERICRYPLAASIDGPMRSTFADSSHGYTSAHAALIINEFFKIPELYALCDLHPDRTMKVNGMHELGMYSGFKVKAESDNRDYALPDLGQAKLRGKPGKNRMTLMCLAGNNGVPHNHNDIGSFIVHKHGKLLLVDPGGPVYSRKTFGPNRYDILFCNSLGHSVPIINGKMQAVGSQYRGVLTVENLNGTGEKSASIDMNRAYPKGTAKSLTRTFVLDTEKNALILKDEFAFARKPKSLEEGFVTFEKARVNGQSVQIGSKASGLTLKAVGCPGKFSIQRFDEASKEGRTGEVVTRISFEPKTLDREMVLTFSIT